MVLTGALVAFAWQNLATYRQEIFAQAASQRALELVALRVMVEAVRPFLSAQPPVSACELPARLHVSEWLANETVEELTAVRWLTAIGRERRLVPPRDPQRRSPAELVDALRRRGESGVWRDRDGLTRKLEARQRNEARAAGDAWGECDVRHARIA
jgi:hypothetical protein